MPFVGKLQALLTRHTTEKSVPWAYVVIATGAGLYIGTLPDHMRLLTAIEANKVPRMGSLAAARPVPYATEYVLPRVGDTDRPPLRMQGDARAIIEMIDPESIEAVCGADTTACTRLTPQRPTMLMPNPCAFPFDAYAALLCHEMGHVNNWRHAEGL